MCTYMCTNSNFFPQSRDIISFTLLSYLQAPIKLEKGVLGWGGGCVGGCGPPLTGSSLKYSGLKLVKRKVWTRTRRVGIPRFPGGETFNKSAHLLTRYKLNPFAFNTLTAVLEKRNGPCCNILPLFCYT